MGTRYRQLDLDERIEVHRLNRLDRSHREIGRLMGRNHTTIGRELARNSLAVSGYKPAMADHMAYVRCRRRLRLECLRPLADHVRDRRRQRIRRTSGHDRQARADIRFCDPHSPWRRGTVENTNGIIRRDMPRKSDISDYTERDIEIIQFLFNSTPRKYLGYKTPEEAFFNQITGALET